MRKGRQFPFRTVSTASNFAFEMQSFDNFSGPNPTTVPEGYLVNASGWCAFDNVSNNVQSLCLECLRKEDTKRINEEFCRFCDENKSYTGTAEVVCSQAVDCYAYHCAGFLFP